MRQHFGKKGGLLGRINCRTCSDSLGPGHSFAFLRYLVSGSVKALSSTSSSELSWFCSSKEAFCSFVG